MEDLSKKTVKELILICQKEKIVGCRRKNKAELVKHVEKYFTGGIPMKPRRKKTTTIKKKVVFNETQKILITELFKSPFNTITYFTKKIPRARGTVFDNMTKLVAQGYVERKNMYYRLTDKGYDVVQEIGKTRTMKKELKTHLIKSFQELAKSEHEYSIGLDWEKYLKYPERILSYKGGETATIHFPDFELFGHSHPNRWSPAPSMADLRNMQLFEPEFIVAGMSGKITFLTLEDMSTYKKWIEKRSHLAANKIPMSNYDVMKGLERFPEYRGIVRDYGEFFMTKKGGDFFRKLTGIKAVPYEGKPIKLKMIEDIYREKPIKKFFPSVPESYLKEYQRKPE